MNAKQVKYFRHQAKKEVFKKINEILLGFDSLPFMERLFLAIKILLKRSGKK